MLWEWSVYLGELLLLLAGCLSQDLKVAVLLDYWDPSKQMGEMSSLQVTLITGRTIDQGVGKEQGKSSEEYRDSVSICQVDPGDLKKLGIKAESNVLVSTEYGSVVVKAVKSPSAPHVGVVFMPYGPWANVIMNTETHSIGMPSLKGIRAEILPAQDRLVLSLPELLKEQFRK